MSTYEPGTVAVATVRGVPNVRVMRIRAGSPYVWMTPEPVGGDAFRHTERDVTDVRPLVVLDPKELGWDTGHSIATCLREHDRKCCAIFDKLADAIEAQTKPPRIPEPGLWGVVEAWRHDQSKVDACTWIRRRGLRPWRCDCGLSALWDELVDPVIVRDGIEEAS